jgi:hypothetical protein
MCVVPPWEDLRCCLVVAILRASNAWLLGDVHEQCPLLEERHVEPKSFQKPPFEWAEQLMSCLGHMYHVGWVDTGPLNEARPLIFLILCIADRTQG